MVRGKYPRYPPLATLPGDVESDPLNYDSEGQLKPKCELQPSELQIFKHMQVYLTKNVRKDVDYVYGMRAEVLGWHSQSRSVRVRTRTGHVVDVWPWSDPDLGDLTYYPVRPGYALTLLKFQGSELPHVTLYLDAFVPGAAFSEISRCSDALISSWVEHCQPITFNQCDDFKISVIDKSLKERTLTVESFELLFKKKWFCSERVHSHT